MFMQTQTTHSNSLKQEVRDYWQKEPCGTRGIPSAERRRFFAKLERERYEWEPYIAAFANFERGEGKRVLEIGVGAGTDFVQWVRHGAIATGIDLTEQGISLTRERLGLEGLQAQLQVADAEELPFSDDSFDIVYSYGVLHHSPDTQRAIEEVRRVLKPGGTAIIMVYHLRSWTTLMQWSLHCAAKLRPWKSPRWAVFHHLESPGTKAYTVKEAHQLFRQFSDINVRTQLSHGDLLKMRPSGKYQHWHHQLAWKLYPRWAIEKTGSRFGTGLFIEATK